MGARVMIVEDERIVAFSMQQRLQKLGYNVSAVVASGAAALEAAIEQTPDIVLMDINIEGDLDGIETAEKLNSADEVPVVYLSAHSEESVLTRAGATKPYGYLIKPFTERELHATIQMALQRSEAEKALRVAKNEIEVINASLESRINERTQQFLDAKREAEMANSAKSIFLANMSHEIRTPLNAVLGLCYLLQKTDLDSVQLDYVKKADSAANYLLSMLNDILDLSKVEAGKLDLESIDFRLGDILGSVISIVSVQAQARGLILDMQLDGTAELALRGDPLRLQQVLMNLSSNAVKFTERGKVSIIVKQKSQTEIEVGLSFTVSDTGPGMSAAQLQHLFEPFHQLDASTTRRYGGSGLGLVISKRLVQLMGGEIQVESKLGAGSSFHFELSFKKAQAAPARFSEVALLSKDNLRGARVLLVEDNVLNQQVASAILRHEGMEIDIADNGSIAVEKVRNLGGHYYDVILMDLQMPQLDGFSATQQIRHLPNAQSIPIIAMTADTVKEDRARCLEVGMNDFVAKPIRVAHLLTTLAQWLSRRPNRGVIPPDSLK